jgi:agmatinase
MAWDTNKLDELRVKYGESHGGEMFDPVLEK